MIALKLLLFLLVGLTLAGVALNMLRTIFKNLSPNDNKIQADIKDMRTEIAPYVEDLVPLESEELELMSLNQLNQSLKKGMTTTAKGVFTSIYQEPLVAYSYKKYIGNNNALLYARTATKEIVYRFTKKGVKVAINQKYYGTIKQGKLYGENNKQLLAQVNTRPMDLMLPVMVGNKEVGMLNSPKQAAKSPQPRAFQFVNNSITEEEETAFLTLAVLELVEKSIGS
ncbi:MAG: hypothetical protein AAF806_09710 [Bacteroidota bacterium]